MVKRNVEKLKERKQEKAKERFRSLGTTPRASRLSTTRPSTKSLPHGPMMGRSGRRSSPVWPISPPRSTSMSACFMATGPTPWPKKGRWDWLLGLQTPEGRKNHRDHGQPWLCLSSRPRCARERNGYEAPSPGPEGLEAGGQAGRVRLARRLPQPRWRL